MHYINFLVFFSLRPTNVGTVRSMNYQNTDRGFCLTHCVSNLVEVHLSCLESDSVSCQDESWQRRERADGYDIYHVWTMDGLAAIFRCFKPHRKRVETRELEKEKSNTIQGCCYLWEAGPGMLSERNASRSSAGRSQDRGLSRDLARHSAVSATMPTFRENRVVQLGRICY